MKKNIWIFCHHTSPPEFGHFTRHYNFSKSLSEKGYKPTVFVGSVPHNTDIQLVEGNEVFALYKKHEFPYVFVKTCLYNKSGKKRLIAMFQYYFRLFKSYKKLLKMGYEKPDVIMGSSIHPLTCVAAIKIAKKLNVPCIVEIKDLWPESIVSYSDKLTKKHLIIKALYKLEKWMYKKADKIVFTMEGGADYVKEQGIDIDMSKIHHVNNGVDIELFDYNKDNYSIVDKDLDNEEIFKAVYTGSIRKANNIGLLLDAAKLITNDKIKILIWGSGNETQALKQRLIDENITNVIFKGAVEKKYVPYITIKSDVNILHSESVSIIKYGMSQNKSFEYLAAGKPIVNTFTPSYDYISGNNAGISIETQNDKQIADAIMKVYNMDKNEYTKMCENARQASLQYDFGVLTDKLIEAVEEA